jgi:hypothetical protein
VRDNFVPQSAPLGLQHRTDFFECGLILSLEALLLVFSTIQILRVQAIFAPMSPPLGLHSPYFPEIPETWCYEHIQMSYVKYEDKTTVSNTIGLTTQLYALC